MHGHMNVKKVEYLLWIVFHKVHLMADEVTVTTNPVAVRKIWLLLAKPFIRDTFKQIASSSLSSELLSEKSTILLTSSLLVDLWETVQDVFSLNFYVRSFATKF